MKKCWEEDPLKRPNAFKIKNIIKSWHKNISNIKVINKSISIESKNDIMEFYKADKILKKKQTDISNTSDIINSKSHS